MIAPGLLRCVTLNLWGAEEPLRARMALVEAGLRAVEPDVVALQEVREIPGRLPNQAEHLAATLGYDCAFAAATPCDGGYEGLAILSRQGVAEQTAIELPHARPDERRVLLSVRLAHAGGPAWVHTSHLNYRLHHGQEREDQVVAIDGELRERMQDADPVQVLLGDFNARPESDEIRYLNGLTTLAGRRTYYQDAWATLHPDAPGLTWAAANPYTERLRFLTRDRRIDYAFVTPMRRDGRGTIHRCDLVFTAPDTNGNFASDHFGLLAEVQVTGLAPPDKPAKVALTVVA